MRLKEACEIALKESLDTLGEAVQLARTTVFDTEEIYELMDDIVRVGLNPEVKIKDFLKRGICPFCDEIPQLDIDHPIDKICIVKDKATFFFYTPPANLYISGFSAPTLTKIDYCPKCGRRLK